MMVLTFMMIKIAEIEHFKGNKDEIVRLGMIFTEVTYFPQIDTSDVVYITYRKDREHFFRIFNGWGLSVDVYHRLVSHHVNKVIIIAGQKWLLSDLSQWSQSPTWMNDISHIPHSFEDLQYVLREKEMILLKGGITKFKMDLKDTAKSYEPKTTKNISDLEICRLDYPVQEREAMDKDGKPFKYKVVLVGDLEYRVPDSVLGDIKNILSAKPTLKTVKVTKKGTGFNTQYTVIPLD